VDRKVRGGSTPLSRTSLLDPGSSRLSPAGVRSPSEQSESSTGGSGGSRRPGRPGSVTAQLFLDAAWTRALRDPEACARTPRYGRIAGYRTDRPAVLDQRGTGHLPDEPDAEMPSGVCRPLDERTHPFPRSLAILPERSPAHAPLILHGPQVRSNASYLIHIAQIPHCLTLQLGQGAAAALASASASTAGGSTPATAYASA
jgi:hypothetical protein